MSSLQIPIDRNGPIYSKIQPPRNKHYYSNSHGKLPPSLDIGHSKQHQVNINISSDQEESNSEVNDRKESNYKKSFTSFIPKMSLNLDKVVEQNPRILDLRQKLNEITKKQDRNVDKQTKALINNITQQLDDKEENESGPYSLLFELETKPSTSKEHPETQKNWNIESEKVDDAFDLGHKNSNMFSKSIDRLPNVINFDDKPMKEYEYSCETENTLPSKKFNVHSRSDLCLHFKPQLQNRFENVSPNENSLNRTNEENSLDDSLGILTPDQMDDICYLENAFSPTVEGLPIFCNNDLKISPDNGDTPSTDKTESNSAVSTMFLNNDNLEPDDTKNKLVHEVSVQITDCEHAIRTLEYNEVDNDCEFKLVLNNSDDDNAANKDLPNENIKNLKEELVSSIMEDELLPSFHSSILEPVSSVADTTVNLDLPLDCKHNENRSSLQRIEHTPSPEELPLDNSDINGEISTYSNSQFSTSTLHDSQTYSDIKNDFTKSIETSKVSNSFITSITSITSLDGYQGDGEMSRPVSRSADHSIGPREDIIEMDWQNVPVTRRVDPMTDSDFFTESDADGLDDHVHRGDRRAQVIDGALYGGNNNNGNPPLLVNRSEDSCMDSSGVYTDFENHRSSPVFLNAIDDMSPEGSSPSTHSECSQKNSNGLFAPLNEIIKSDSNMSYIMEDVETPISSSKRNSLNSVKELNTNDKVPKEEKRSFTLKKYKMPKRDVPSKLKTILASRKNENDSSIQVSPKTVKKIERRENLGKKSSANDTKNDHKTKPYKDIKSKVDCSFSLQRSQTACSVTRMLSSKSTSTNVKPKR